MLYVHHDGVGNKNLTIHTQVISEFSSPLWQPASGLYTAVTPSTVVKFKEKVIWYQLELGK